MPDRFFLNCVTKILLLRCFSLSPLPFAPISSGKKKKVKPPRILITEDGKALNVNDPKYVRPKRGLKKSSAWGWS